MSSYLSFKKNEDARTALQSWWKNLENSRGDRAELRRCRTLTDVAFCRAYHRLLHSLLQCGLQVNRERLALVAGLSAQVKQDVSGKSLAEQMASPVSGRTGVRVSGLRFRQLLAVTDPDELFRGLVRIIHLLGGSANLPALADDAYWRNERTRKQWAYDYYKTAPSEN